jgi:hypothetical protein
MKRAATMVALAAATAACGHTDPLSQMVLTGPPVMPVVTEHTAGLQCLGDLIDASSGAPVTVQVYDIDDTTVPVLNEERRLSLGGSFVLQTAISRLESDKVTGALDDRGGGARRLVLSGAWTQDDQFVSRSGLGFQFSAGHFAGGIGGQRAYDFIAGDFASSVNGRIRLSTAVGVAIPRAGGQATLIVDDGRDGAEIGVDRRMVQGPQMAQRRILEAVALVHLANYYEIDYRPCLEASHTMPQAFIDAVERFESARGADRVRLVQEELQRLGHLTSAPDGAWGPISARSLAAFQRQRNLPVTGQPSGAVYALLATTP